MKAVVFVGDGTVRVEDVPRPALQSDGDAIVQVTRTAICGSDLHLLDGHTEGMQVGSVIGHEFVGTLFDAGDDVTTHFDGARVLGSFLIACGECAPCKARRFNLCAQRRALGLGVHTGNLDGAQAEFVRVPNADLNLKGLTGGLSGLSDEEALFGGDVLATGFYGASLAELGPDETAVVIGAGPVGIFTAGALARSGQVLMLDTDPSRVAAARALGFKAALVDDDNGAALVAEATGGALADVAIDAVGHTSAFKSGLRCVKEGGRIVVLGVYGSERYPLPMGVLWSRGIDIRFSGMANVHAHWDDALLMVAKGEIEPTKLITHRLPLEDAAEGYEEFAARRATKVVLTP